jgi:hypothetical protein
MDEFHLLEDGVQCLHPSQSPQKSKESPHFFQTRNKSHF